MAFDESYNKDLADTNNIAPSFTGDMTCNFGLDYSKRKINYNLSSSYAFGGGLSKEAESGSMIWSINSDQMSLSNSLSYSLEHFNIKSSLSISSQVFREVEDSIIMSSFLSPGCVNWSLGMELQFAKSINGSVTLNFASAQCMLLINQDLYKSQETENLNGVDIGHFFCNVTGMKFDYNFSKVFHDDLNISNSGNLFFPGQGKIFTQEWLNNFNFQIDNEISYSFNEKCRFSIQTRFSFNNYLNKSIELYNKIAIGIVFK